MEHESGGWRSVVAGRRRLRVTRPARARRRDARAAARAHRRRRAVPGAVGPAAARRAAARGRDGHVFLERYAGGWQELFPSANDPTDVRRRRDPLPRRGRDPAWDAGGRDEGRLVCRVRCERTPLALERRMSLEAGHADARRSARRTSPTSSLSSRGVTTACSARPSSRRAAGSTLPARTIVTIPEMWEDTARLAPGQRSAWPNAQLRAGGTVDLREVPGPEAGSHDDVYLTDLEDGEVSVENPRLGLTFRLELRPVDLPLDDLVAALRRRAGDAARRRLRARRRAVGLRGCRSARRPRPARRCASDRARPSHGAPCANRKGGRMAGVTFEGTGKVFKDGTRALGRSTWRSRTASSWSSSVRPAAARRPRCGWWRGWRRSATGDPDRRPRRERRSTRATATSRWSSRTTRCTRT